MLLLRLFVNDEVLWIRMFLYNNTIPIPMERYDAIIAGGGPAGGLAGNEIAGRGFNVLILEEHQQVGKPVQCAGLVSQRTLEVAGVNDISLNPIYGLRMVAPDGYELEFRSDNVKALVIDRSGFDRLLLKKALDNGCELKLRSRFMGAERNINGLRVRYRENNVLKTAETKILIGADGSQSAVRKKFGFPEPKETLSGFEVELAGVDIEQDIVHVFLGRNLAPGFFLWVIPVSRDTARVGLCVGNEDSRWDRGSGGSAFLYLKRFLKSEKASFLRNGKQLQLIAGSIPIGFMKRTVTDNVLLVGDAAAQVKPLSGGGLYPGLECARLCGRVVISSLEKEDYSAKFLKEYEAQWHKSMGREIRSGLRLRKFFLRLEDEKFNELARLLDREDILETIAQYGDIDFPSTLTQPLLKKAPLLLISAAPFLKRLF